MRNFLVTLGIMVSFVLLARPAYANETHVVLISQIRGQECCDLGSLAAFGLQMQTLQELGLKATFALRFDALSDPAYVQLLQEPGNAQHERALFLEITPGLRQQAGVAERPLERWYKAKHAYLLGYTPEERLRLIDTAMARYKEAFGTYPSTTAGWMIDATSLSYLHERYGVQTHQLTREQWGTDSYTLYGGPVNTPYRPSKNWPLIPASNQASGIDILIIRQTLPDPLLTYGDSEAVYTSQPNDYMKGNLSHAYFEKLIGNLATQTPYGFAAIGIENSMPEEYQREYIAQLRTLHRLQSSSFTVEPVNQFRTRSLPSTSVAVFASKREDPYNAQAFWVGTATYRARVLIKDQRVIITDLRLYGDSLEDPYGTTPPSSDNAYWVAPFLLDASRYMSTPPPSLFRTLTRGGEEKEHPTNQDALHVPDSGIELPPSTESWPAFQIDATRIQLRYTTLTGPVTLVFGPRSFSFSIPQGTQATYNTQVPDLDALQRTEALSWNRVITGNTTTFTPSIAAGTRMEELIRSFPRQLQPERQTEAISQELTPVILANHIAIAGRNPIRVVLYARDDQGNPVVLTKDPTVRSEAGELVSVTVQHPESAKGEYYIDISQPTPGEHQLLLTVAGTERRIGTISFIPDCLRNVVQCAMHPQYFTAYVRMKLEERF